MYLPRASSSPRFNDAGEPEPLVVADDAEPRFRNVREYLGRAIGRRVVDNEKLEIARRLAECAGDRRTQIALAIVNGEEHGDERRDWHGRPVAYGPCRGSFRRSTSSSRRSIVPTSWLGSSTRSRRRNIHACASSSWTRTQTSGFRKSWRGAMCSVEHVRAERRSLTRTQRRARARRCRRRRIS